MNELTGTITLAYVEEDNSQRVIFRLIPLCTKEGFQFHGTSEEFPDEGSLRIIPDKREQGSFKDRMRGISGFCAIILPSDGKEKMKIRQNRNYRPEAGENNRNAIYSDVICQFAPDGCFEVVEAGSDPATALTKQILLHKDMMLYGPVKKEEAASTDLTALKPFGNDQFLLHTVEASTVGKRKVYWNPEMLISWRQFKIAGPKKEKTEGTVPTEKASSEKVVPVKPTNQETAEKQQKPAVVNIVSAENKAAAENKVPVEAKTEAKIEAKKPVQGKPKAEAKEAASEPKTGKKKLPENPKKGKGTKLVQDARPQEKAAEPIKADKPPKQRIASPLRNDAGEHAEENDAALPIGKNLDILDNEISFDQQLDRLAQPLSDSANCLTVQTAKSTETETEEPEEEEKTFHPSGTELKKDLSEKALVTGEPVNVFRVVEKALRSHAEDKNAAVNPVGCLRDCVDAIWQDRELREQAVSALLDNGEFMNDISLALRKRGADLHLMAAAEAQLAEIEAERIELLMQLRTARENEKQYQKDTLAKISQKRKDEAERLKKDLERMRAEKNRLLSSEKTLSRENQTLIRNFVAANASSLGGISQRAVTISPVIGEQYEGNVLAENLRINMNNNGFSISEDEAQVLLICFGLFNALCLKGDTAADAVHFATVLLGSLGLQSVSAVIGGDTQMKLINLLKEDAAVTPTVSIQQSGTGMLQADGHKVLYVEGQTAEKQELLSVPVFHVPNLSENAYYGQILNDTVPSPASLSSFDRVNEVSKKLNGEAEKWFDELQGTLNGKGVHVSQSTYMAMRRFVAAASNVLRGGFPLAADFAVCLWIVPVLKKNGAGAQALEGISVGLTRTLSLL